MRDPADNVVASRVGDLRGHRVRQGRVRVGVLVPFADLDLGGLQQRDVDSTRAAERIFDLCHLKVGRLSPQRFVEHPATADEAEVVEMSTGRDVRQYRLLRSDNGPGVIEACARNATDAGVSPWLVTRATYRTCVSSKNSPTCSQITSTVVSEPSAGRVVTSVVGSAAVVSAPSLLQPASKATASTNDSDHT